MTVLDIPQLLVLRTNAGPAIVAKSADILFEWEEFALRTATDYGEVPVGTLSAVFALPVNSERIAVVTVRAADGSASFRCLFVERTLYRWIGDPFEIADHYPSRFLDRGSLSLLVWPNDPRPARTISEVRRILEHGDSPLLLGATQALLDGAKLRFQRDEPGIVRELWRLLPDASRGDYFPAEYCPGTLKFHAAVVPKGTPPQPGTLIDEQIYDYPAGRYETALQVAAEENDQRALDALLARPAPQQMMKMALLMLIFTVAVVILLRVF